MYNTLCWLSCGYEGGQGCTIHYAGCLVVMKVVRVVQYNYYAGCLVVVKVVKVVQYIMLVIWWLWWLYGCTIHYAGCMVVVVVVMVVQYIMLVAWWL